MMGGLDRAWRICLFTPLLYLVCVTAYAGPPIPLLEAKHLYDFTTADGLELAVPSDVAIGKDDRVYVVDGGNHRVLAFSKTGQHLFTIGKRGRHDGEFRWPLGVGTDKQGNVYVADKENQRIQVFDSDGNFKFHFLVRFRKGGIGVPIDVAVSKDSGLIFVTENKKHQIMVFDSDGTPLGGWGREGVNLEEFRYPATIHATNERIFVVDSLNTTVKIFDERGRFEFQLGAWGVLPGQFFRPKGVAVGHNGLTFVSDGYMDVVEIFDADHKFSHVLATDGVKHKFHAPGGMAVDSKERLYVAELLGNKVSVFELP